MRSNGKRAGEWSDEEYHRRKAREEKERQNAPRKPGNGVRMRESEKSDADGMGGPQSALWGDFV